jgi:hypothetical protein
MLFNGRTIKISLFVLCCACSMISSSWADFNQFMSGSEHDISKEKRPRKPKPTPHMPLSDKTEGEYDRSTRKKVKDSPHVANRMTDKDSLLRSTQVDPVGADMGISGDGLKFDYYTGMSGDQVLKQVHRKGKTAYGLRYLTDQYEYTDPRSTFKKTFQDGDDSIQGGILQISGERYFWRKYVDLSLVAQVGVGYNKGVGIFVDGAVSQTKFQLWTLPLDVGLALSIPLGRWIALQGSAGPSALGLIQTRSDRERGSAEREKRQYSHGYFAQAVLRLNLSRIIPSTGFTVFRDYDASNFYIDIVGRTQSYRNFKDPLEITGTSLGLGFSFDFL